MCGGALADVTKAAQKGALVLVSGDLGEPGAWIDREGKARAEVVVLGREFRFLEPRRAAAPETIEEAEEHGADEDIPF